jgi:hypothetical protein
MRDEGVQCFPGLITARLQIFETPERIHSIVAARAGQMEHFTQVITPGQSG